MFSFYLKSSVTMILIFYGLFDFRSLVAAFY
jgi:hypothetical protein